MHVRTTLRKQNKLLQVLIEHITLPTLQGDGDPAYSSKAEIAMVVRVPGVLP